MLTTAGVALRAAAASACELQPLATARLACEAMAATTSGQFRRGIGSLLLAKAKEQNGSIICAEILGLKGHEKAQSSYVASARTAEYYKSRPCAAKVESAARIFAEYLMEKK